jgi:deazaflavin-dependent oxidoreductase (nitroreductase family)
LAGTPLILIHHVGATSGIERVTPLVCTPQRDGRYVIVGSNGGSPTHPSWYYNLKANPTIKVEFGAETFLVRAAELTGAKRSEHWARLVADSSSLREFARKTSRSVPVFVLTREERTDEDALGSPPYSYDTSARRRNR